MIAESDKKKNSLGRPQWLGIPCGEFMICPFVEMEI
jgi:hypothetical protein